MMPDEKPFTPEAVDEQIDRLAQMPHLPAGAAPSTFEQHVVGDFRPSFRQTPKTSPVPLCSGESSWPSAVRPWVFPSLLTVTPAILLACFRKGKTLCNRSSTCSPRSSASSLISAAWWLAYCWSSW